MTENATEHQPQTLVDALIDAVAAMGGVELELPARTEPQRPVSFE
ncbi:hypothetical protein [Jiangella mangrovi]|uniref:Uncharacterized protein n=1 Tax=Jiangella mangrovi TaxID=1524084 RepID=A0A7W9LMM7_9ACTN|nr:hypothetical protein [Jiangella mangrovi]MBB5789267.1 hypothetical protein [Jiangella mangrovi]